MHTYAIAVAKQGRSLPRSVLDVLSEQCPPEVTFQANEHLLWTDDEHRVAIGGWQAGTETFGLGSHWTVTSEGLHAFSGLPWPRHGEWRQDAPWSEQIGQRVVRGPIEASLEAFSGIYTMLALGRDGTGWVASDPLAFAPL